MTFKNFEPRPSHDGKRTRYVYYPAQEGHMVKLTISHREGGRNHFSGAVEKRGVQISIIPVEIVPQERGLTMESTMIGGDDDGARLLVAEAPRYSAKKIAAVVAAFDDKASELCAKWKDDRAAALVLLKETAAAATRLAA